MLGISIDYAFCLHSKERVPYHIIIKVALDDKSGRQERSNSLNSPTGVSYDDYSSSEESESLLPPNLSLKDPSNSTELIHNGEDKKAIEMVDMSQRSSSHKNLLTSSKEDSSECNSSSPLDVDELK